MAGILRQVSIFGLTSSLVFATCSPLAVAQVVPPAEESGSQAPETTANAEAGQPLPQKVDTEPVDDRAIEARLQNILKESGWFPKPT